MDLKTNPFSPGAGTPPPELAGRQEVIDRVAVSLARIRAGRSAKSHLLVGLRGVGKTVLLNRLRADAEASGVSCVVVEAPESRSLPAMLVPPLRAALLKLDRIQGAGEQVKRALRALGGFAKGMKLRYADVEFNLDLMSEAGLADTGDLDTDLTDLLQAVGDAAKARGTALAMFVDELQYVEPVELAALIAGLHRCGQNQLPVTLVGAGLPQLVGNTGKAKSYAERLFDFPEIGPLEAAAAAAAIEVPARALGVLFTYEAIGQILSDTQRYPYFLQEWGKHSWDLAAGPVVTLEDVRDARERAVADLDASFFRVRFDRLTPAEKTYLRAMADLGGGSHRSGDIAAAMHKKSSSVGPVRDQLIKKGMVYSPSHGDTAFTVPLFDGFLKRVMPPV